MISEINTQSPSCTKTVGDPLEYISASRVSCWQQCRRKFYFRYVEKLPSGTSAALHLGKAVHAALQSWNLKRWNQEEIDTDQLYKEFMEAWLKLSIEDSFEWESQEAEKKAFEHAWHMIKVYLEKTPIDVSEPILGVEVKAEAKLPGLPPILGYIDLVRGGELGGRIVDFKTAAKSPSTSTGSLTHATQLGIYALLYRENTGEVEAGLELHHLVKTKQPKVVVTTVEPLTDLQMDQLMELLHTYVDAIKAEDFTASPNFMCGGCEYLDACQNWQPRQQQKGGTPCGM